MKKKFLGILLACVMVLSACGKETKESEKQTLQVEEEGTRYTMEEVSLPDPLISENSEGSDYVGDDFSGFVPDLDGKPAVYYSNFSIENEEYYASVTRWSLDEDKNWVCEDLCENSLSEFMNQKYEQVSWGRCSIHDFKRGDD